MILHILVLFYFWKPLYDLNYVPSKHVSLLYFPEKPQGVSFKCLYNAKENKVWLFPISTSKNDKINNSKFCQSSTANQWCSSQSASWAEASCSKFNETTQGCAIKKIDKHAIYITQTTLENDFGQSVFRHTLENPRQKCMSGKTSCILCYLTNYTNKQNLYSGHFAASSGWLVH